MLKNNSSVGKSVKLFEWVYKMYIYFLKYL